MSTGRERAFERLRMQRAFERFRMQIGAQSRAPEGPPSCQVRRAHGQRLHRERLRAAAKSALAAWRAEQKAASR